MNLVKAKCTSCGAALEVDSAQDAAICPYCNTPYIVEKAIKNYYTATVEAMHGVGHVGNAEKVVYNINVYNSERAAPAASAPPTPPAQPYVPPKPAVSDKSRMTALLLCVFLGFLGIHRFYVGRKISGILWLCTMGLFGYGWLFDIVWILLGNFKDSHNFPLK